MLQSYTEIRDFSDMLGYKHALYRIKILLPGLHLKETHLQVKFEEYRPSTLQLQHVIRVVFSTSSFLLSVLFSLSLCNVKADSRPSLLHSSNSPQSHFT